MAQKGQDPRKAQVLASFHIAPAETAWMVPEPTAHCHLTHRSFPSKYAESLQLLQVIYCVVLFAFLHYKYPHSPTLNTETYHFTTLCIDEAKSELKSRKMKVLFATLLVCSLLLSSSLLEPAMAQPRSTFCAGKCGARCKKAALWDRCIKYCGLCCEECKCVPSGTYGNKHECPCYRDKVNKKGKPKCP